MCSAPAELHFTHELTLIALIVPSDIESSPTCTCHQTGWTTNPPVIPKHQCEEGPRLCCEYQRYRANIPARPCTPRAEYAPPVYRYKPSATPLHRFLARNACRLDRYSEDAAGVWTTFAISCNEHLGKRLVCFAARVWTVTVRAGSV